VELAPVREVPAPDESKHVQVIQGVRVALRKYPTSATRAKRWLLSLSSNRTFRPRFFRDKAIDLIDEDGAR